jgi:membrane-associated phospholipid phosphatase
MTGRLGSRRDAAFAALFTGLAVAAYFLYPLTNHGPNRIFLQTALDRAMPLVPIMVVPYISLIPLIGLAGLVVVRMGWRNLQGYALAIAIALAICCIVYVVAQSYVARPEITGHGVLDQWVRDVYSDDQPYDDFPSTHTALATIIAIYCRRGMRRTGTVIACWCVLIVASTVLIHQHYVADIAGGLVVAGIAVAGADRLVRMIARSANAAEPVPHPVRN